MPIPRTCLGRTMGLTRIKTKLCISKSACQCPLRPFTSAQRQPSSCSFPLIQAKAEVFAGLDSQRVPSFSGSLTENCLFVFSGLLQCQFKPGPIQLHQSNWAPKHDITWHSWHSQVLQTNGHHGSQTIQITFRYISYFSAQILPSCLFSQLHMNQGCRKEGGEGGR